VISPAGTEPGPPDSLPVVCGRHSDHSTAQCLPQIAAQEFSADTTTAAVEVSAANCWGARMGRGECSVSMGQSVEFVDRPFVAPDPTGRAVAIERSTMVA